MQSGEKYTCFFFNNEIPTIDKVLESVNNDDSLPNFKKDMMHQLMKKLGFKYSKRNRKSMLIDKPDIAVWRVKYLNEMAKYRRDGKKIYYLDETWVNEGNNNINRFKINITLSTLFKNSTFVNIIKLLIDNIDFCRTHQIFNMARWPGLQGGPQTGIVNGVEESQRERKTPYFRPHR